MQILKRATFLSLAATFALSASAVSAAEFDAAQKDEIGKIAADYLIAHPEVLVQVSQALQQKQQVQQMQGMQKGAVGAVDQLVGDEGTPAVGPKDAKVAVVQFFDYQCIYCYKMSAAVEELIEKNPKVRFVFKEFPIFGSRWPASTLAAETGLQVYRKGGADAYLKYHNALYATGKNEGKLTGDDIQGVAKAAGVSLDDVKAATDSLDQQLQKHMELGQKVGVAGTPTFVILPTKGATAENVTVIPGAADVASVQQAIEKAAR